MPENNNTRMVAARAFVRSLNILLKFARMYDFGHPRTARQYETAWSELHTALGSDNEAGLLLAVSGEQLLLDGTPLDSAAAERSFAKMLSSAGIASIQFSPKVTQPSLARMVRGFPAGTGSKPGLLAMQLKAALDGDPHIHVNEVCFVPADSAVARSTMAAQLAARTMGFSSSETDELLNDPEKLLQLMVAAEGARGKGEGLGPGSGAGLGPGLGPGYGPGLGPGLGPGYGPGNGGAQEGSDSAPGTSGTPNLGPGYGPGLGPGLGAGYGPGPGGAGGNSDFFPGMPGLAGGVPANGEAVASGVPGAASAAGNGYDHGSVPVEAAVHFIGSQHPVVASSLPAGVGNADAGGSLARWANASSGIRGNRPARGAQGSMTMETGLMTLQETELQGILQVLAQIGRSTEAPNDKIDMQSFQSRLSVLPRRARFTVSQALSALAGQAAAPSAEKPTLMRLAEHIAVRFALESYERGDVKVNAVRQMMEEMSGELDGLRKILGAHEERMMQAGIAVQSHAEILAQDFWSKVPVEKLKSVLVSEDAWCVPVVKMRAYVEDLLSRGEKEAAEETLRNLFGSMRSPDPRIRRHASIAVADLAGLYAKQDPKLFADTIRDAGLQLADERDPELQSLVGAAFVRLSQEALQNRVYPAMQRAVELMDYMDAERPGTGKIVRPRIAVETRLNEFIEESVREGELSGDLRQFLRRLPLPAVEHIARRYARSGFREDSDLLLNMMESLGTEALEHLRVRLREGDTTEALDVVAILARMDLDTVEQILPERMKDWKRSSHDRVVRQIAASAAPQRGKLLFRLFDSLDNLILPLAVDEIGMCGEGLTDMRLLRIAEGDLPDGATDYLWLKAIEALGRLRTRNSEPVLRKILEARKTWRWAYAAELRIAAAQALERINPDWVRDFIPRSGLSIADFAIEPLDSDPNSSAIRQRRYPRLRLEQSVPGTTTNLRENCLLQIPELGLGGGVAISEQSLHPGSVVDLRLGSSDRTVRAQAIVRDANTQARAFEVVNIEMDERNKLRRLLVRAGNLAKQSTPFDRKRSGIRTLRSTT